MGSMRCYVCHGSGLDCSNPHCVAGYCADEGPSDRVALALLFGFVVMTVAGLVWLVS